MARARSLLAVSVCLAVCCGGVVEAAREFPAGFRWGAASAAYQVEGAWNHSDKGESIWDRLTHTRPELVSGGATGDVACDSHRLWDTDAQLAADLGLHFYRLSMSWPRLLPDGLSHRVSSSGAQYYSSLLDALLSRGVRPVVTLYHWDLPQRLQDLGGWTNPLIVEWFAEYARVAFRLFGARVDTWVTINEPIVMCDMAYITGAMAPTVRDPLVGPHLCARHVLLAHAAAYRVYDEEFRHLYHGQVSLANHLMWFEAATEEDEEIAELTLQMSAGRYSEPIFGAGGWPAAAERLVEDNSRRQGYPRSRMPPFTDDEIKFIKGTFDFYAMNHYSSRTVRRRTEADKADEAADRSGMGGLPWPLGQWRELPAVMGTRQEWRSAGNNWLKINPAGLRKMLAWIKRQYGDIPILITENGYATLGMNLDDQDRVQYYEEYLEQVLLAIRQDGVNVTGYTAWTLLDNFEWTDGYNTKFGLYEVDFSSPHRPRAPRLSARYYASVIKHNSLDVPKDYYKDELYFLFYFIYIITSIYTLG